MLEIRRDMILPPLKVTEFILYSKFAKSLSSKFGVPNYCGSIVWCPSKKFEQYLSCSKFVYDQPLV